MDTVTLRIMTVTFQCPIATPATPATPAATVVMSPALHHAPASRHLATGVRVPATRLVEAQRRTANLT